MFSFVQPKHKFSFFSDVKTFLYVFKKVHILCLQCFLDVLYLLLCILYTDFRPHNFVTISVIYYLILNVEFEICFVFCMTSFNLFLNSILVTYIFDSLPKHYVLAFCLYLNLLKFFTFSVIFLRLKLSKMWSPWFKCWFTGIYSSYILECLLVKKVASYILVSQQRPQIHLVHLGSKKWPKRAQEQYYKETIPHQFQQSEQFSSLHFLNTSVLQTTLLDYEI